MQYSVVKFAQNCFKNACIFFFSLGNFFSLFFSMISYLSNVHPTEIVNSGHTETKAKKGRKAYTVIS